MRISRVLGFVVLLVACGGDVQKDGTPANSGANSSTFNSSTVQPNVGMEQGSSDSDVQQAFRRLLPVLCAYDQTCAEPLLGAACPTATQYAGDLSNQCWIVDQQKLTECENALRGLQCQGQYENIPPECGEGVKQCQCLDGYVQEWVDDATAPGCYLPCNAGDPTCGGGTQCYDGVCTPPQTDRCPDSTVRTEVNGEMMCLPSCQLSGECDAGFACSSGLCVPNEE